VARARVYLSMAYLGLDENDKAVAEMYAAWMSHR
jgi:hypothetical protein